MNRWTEHVKQYSKKNKITFKDALQSAKCKNAYIKRGLGGGMSINNRINQLKQEIREDLHYLQSIRDFNDFRSLEEDDPNLYYYIINALDEIQFNLTPYLDVGTEELERNHRHLHNLVLSVHQYFPHVPVPRTIQTNSNNPQVSIEQNIISRMFNSNRRLPEATHLEPALLTEIRNRPNTNTVARAQNSRENSIHSNISDSSEFTDNTPRGTGIKTIKKTKRNKLMLK